MIISPKTYHKPQASQASKQHSHTNTHRLVGGVAKQLRSFFETRESLVVDVASLFTGALPSVHAASSVLGTGGHVFNGFKEDTRGSFLGRDATVLCVVYSQELFLESHELGIPAALFLWQTKEQNVRLFGSPNLSTSIIPKKDNS